MLLLATFVAILASSLAAFECPVNEPLNKTFSCAGKKSLFVLDASKSVGNVLDMNHACISAQKDRQDCLYNGLQAVSLVDVLDQLGNKNGYLQTDIPVILFSASTDALDIANAEIFRSQSPYLVNAPFSIVSLSGNVEVWRTFTATAVYNAPLHDIFNVEGLDNCLMADSCSAHSQCAL